MKYCSQCAGKIIKIVPKGDHRLREVCSQCGHIFYQNPRIITGCLPVWQGKILLCQRAIEPRYGLWTLPAGFMENGETLQQGAARETWEEAQAKVKIKKLYTLFNLPHINQVYAFFLSLLEDGTYAPGDESLAVRLFAPEQIPWSQLAFSVVQTSLELYIQDQKKGHFPMRLLDLNIDKG